MPGNIKRIQLLSDTEVEELYARPEFSTNEQALYFSLNKSEQSALQCYANLKTRVYFILQLGYFKATQQFGSLVNLAKAKQPFELSDKYHNFFTGDYKTNFKKLNLFLDALNVKVPTLYKQYSELCDNNGSHFIDFSIDPDFSNCIDGLILVSIDEIKPKKIKHYIGCF